VLLLATTNRDKVREIQQLLRDLPVRFAGLDTLPPVTEPEETGATFPANARLKAFYYDAHRAQSAAIGPAYVSSGPAPRVLTVAEDSGLEIDALDGAPGVLSARFLRPDATYAERFAEIDHQLSKRPGAPRTARFRCAIAVVTGGVLAFETVGTVEGLIAAEPRGQGGFGYDPVFWFPPLAATLAEVSAPEKLAVSHRGHAFRQLAAWLADAGVLRV
jgi:XTP/dITP diphosphohydrolase